ncbi:hypothetical protein HALLA_07210 [Halostagnicola larsenii XH-48]|uniref:Uncharacterized protein n=1 Tax=Halostagnicola larsenii XH-48 TaxID=797299 RepID=W0JQ05_9EURY|nr:hypothetical protein [Halostagnicola larsenii]AHG00781.1 hypothetical protein HALLA_07210 [Halostagnicola larsenii XH-48]
MPDSVFVRFVITAAVASVFVFTLTTLLLPPDPISQLLAGGLLVVVVLPISFLLSYGGGYESLAKRVD